MTSSMYAAQQSVVLNVAVYRSDNLSDDGQAAATAQLKDLTQNMSKIGITVKVVSDVTGDISGPLHGKGLTQGAFNMIVATGVGIEAGANPSGSGFSPGHKLRGAVINEHWNWQNKDVMTHEVLHGLNRDWSAANGLLVWLAALLATRDAS